MEAAGPPSAVKTPPGVAARQTAVKLPAGRQLWLARLRLARPGGGLGMAAALFQATATDGLHLSCPVSGTHLQLSSLQLHPRHLPLVLRTGLPELLHLPLLSPKRH